MPSAGLAARILIPEMWGTPAIGFMWLAVIFVAASDSQVTSTNSSTSQMIVPASAFGAFFAFLGTAAVAKRVYGSRKRHGATGRWRPGRPMKADLDVGIRRVRNDRDS